MSLRNSLPDPADQARIAEIMALLESTRRALTRATCLAGFSDGKKEIQEAHIAATKAIRAVDARVGMAG